MLLVQPIFYIMQRHFFLKIITFIALSLIISACSALPDWVGADDEVALDGERLSVLKVQPYIRVDRDIADIKVRVPQPEENKRWYKSSGYHPLTYPNPSLPEEIEIIEKESIGADGEKGRFLSATPVIVDGKIYTIDGKAMVSAFDLSDLDDPLWEVKLHGKKQEGNFSSGGISYYNNRLYITSGSNHLVVLDAQSGNEIWRRTLESIARSAPEVRDDRVYVNTINNRLYAIDAQLGSILWTHSGVSEDISLIGNASPVATNNVVLSPYSSGEMFALNTQTSDVLWYASFLGDTVSSTYSLTDIDASPVVNNGKIYTISNDGVLASTDLFTGERDWSLEVSGTQVPWVIGEFLFVLNDKDQLIGVHTPTGKVKWVTALRSYKNPENNRTKIHWSGPIMAGNHLYIVGSHGKLLKMSAPTGNIVTKYKVPKEIYLPPVAAHNKLFLLSNDAELIVMGKEE